MTRRNPELNREPADHGGYASDGPTSRPRRYERARQTFHSLLEAVSEAELAKRTRGTRWTSGQLLRHMLFGDMIVRALRSCNRASAAPGWLRAGGPGD